MPLIQLSNIHLAYGPLVLLDNEELVIRRGERYGLLGRNGAGKSSFMKLLSGEIRADSGELWVRPGTRIACLAQELPTERQSVYDYIADGLPEAGRLLQEFHHLSAHADQPGALDKMEKVQQKLEAIDGWTLQQKVETAINLLGLDAEEELQNLSGGGARRAALGRALVSEPDVLLLDEPTNHLDILSVEWLENYLRDFRGALVTITHDRAFLQKVADRIIELDRGKLKVWEHDYQRFLEYRDQALAAEERANAEFDKKLAEEERWIRQGIKARRTRNEGRVRALEKMREEFKARRSVQGKAKMQLNEAESSGKIVVEAEHIHHAFDDKLIVKDFSIKILRGDKIGLIGPNGVGKTTLLNILLGKLTPDQGTMKIGTKLEVAYFDQTRAQLDAEKSVIDNLADHGDFIEVRGKSRHVISYLQDFLFTPDRIRQPVKALSGGEQNRLILARMFSKPANLMVLDEPTNDLDLETLELLEELLLDFEGTLLLVSHDRAFLDHVVTSSIVFEGLGSVAQYVGGYTDWVSAGGNFRRPEQQATASADTSQSATSPAPTGEPKTMDKESRDKKAKLSYKLQRELEELPGRIEETEQLVAELEETIAEAGFYEQDHHEVEATLARLGREQETLETLYARWEELDSL